MIGCNGNGKLLSDVNVNKWEKHWKKITRQVAHIELVHNSDGVIGYIVDHNTPEGFSEMIEPYNVDLLKMKRLG